MKVKLLKTLISFFVGVLLITTWSLLICVDHLVGNVLIKEFIGSFCVGLCIGKIMWTIGFKSKSEPDGSEINKEDKYE